MQQKKRIALVTGGIRGIGGSISKELKDMGFQVIANYRGNDEVARAFTEETGIPAYAWDVSNYEACRRGIEKVKHDFGSIDILINNAGITCDAFLHKMEPHMWVSVLETNLYSLFNMCHQVIPDMREKNFGRIINISSVNGLAGQIGQTNYSAAKAGAIGFTKALAKENARKGITVNCVAPGYVDTDMTASLAQDVLEEIINMIPLKRLGKKREVSKLVAFLTQDDASFITGTTFSINGGQYMA